MGADSGLLSFVPAPNRSLPPPQLPLSCLSTRPLHLLVQAPSTDCRDGCKRPPPRPPTPASAPLRGSDEGKNVALVPNGWKRHPCNPAPLGVHRWHFVVSSVSPAAGCVFVRACIHTRVTHACTRIRGWATPVGEGSVVQPGAGVPLSRTSSQFSHRPFFRLAQGVTGAPHSTDCSRDPCSEADGSRPRSPHPHLVPPA